MAELAGWDRDVLAIEMQGLLELEFDDVELTGFSIAEIDLILEKSAGKERQARSCRGRRGGKPRRSAQRPAFHGRAICGSWGRTASTVASCNPRDCDVMIRRWQRAYRDGRRLDGSGLTFAEVEAARLAGQIAAAAASCRE